MFDEEDCVCAILTCCNKNDALRIRAVCKTSKKMVDCLFDLEKDMNKTWWERLDAYLDTSKFNSSYKNTFDVTTSLKYSIEESQPSVPVSPPRLLPVGYTSIRYAHP